MDWEGKEEEQEKKRKRYVNGLCQQKLRCDAILVSGSGGGDDDVVNQFIQPWRLLCSYWVPTLEGLFRMWEWPLGLKSVADTVNYQ